MISDQLCVFSDNVAVRATANSAAIAAMPFLGKGDAPLVSVCVTEAYPATATLSIAVQESDDNATFTTLSTLEVPKARLSRVGAFVFPLPSGLRGSFVRLAYTVGGSPASGKLWAGVTRDMLDATEPGQQVRPGRAGA